jgi:hypothetical protein
MAVCLVMQFTGVDAAKYESVMEELGLQSTNANWPKGIISHVAGFDSDGMYVWTFGNRSVTLTPMLTAG